MRERRMRGMGPLLLVGSGCGAIIASPAPLVRLVAPALRRRLALRVLEVHALALLVHAIDRVAGLHDVELLLRLEASRAALLLGLLGARLGLLVVALLLEAAPAELDLALPPALGRFGLRRGRVDLRLDLRRLAVGRRLLGVVRDALLVHPFVERRPHSRGSGGGEERRDQGSSSRKVRHLALPPAFMNSDNGVCTTSKPFAPSAR